MFENLLVGYSNDEYVYIIESCLEDYASLQPASDERCPFCGETEWPITEGFVKDIKRATEIEEIGFNPTKKLVLKKWNNQ